MRVSKHIRKNIPLVGHDCTSAGYAFITICIQHQLFLLGEIIQDKLYLSAHGERVKAWLLKFPEKGPICPVDEFAILPEHIHFFLINNDQIKQLSLVQLMHWFSTMLAAENLQQFNSSNKRAFEKHL
ncbi:transposase [Sphingobacterium humi]|uniref:Transposase IS200-like domain-containing protein n=1 Tax=Sphingobacterium humi TaxID=1796905 RepID=A0A6N8KV19_9SPHI|nr:transposase [Sphingobacterium humi]MVZ61310.1 hypothetical protein [Sphingobacterium humi]